MFNLEKSITEWREQMLAAGIKSPVALEELEGHLREEIERLTRANTTPPQAFEIAVKKLGQASELKREFKKIGDTLETRLLNLMGAAWVTVAFLFSLWTSLFLFSREIGLTAQALGLVALVVTAAGWKYNHKFLPVIRNHWIRPAIGFACGVGGVIWMQLFIRDFMPGMMVHPHSATPRGELMALFLWGWAILAMLGGIGHGLERAARKSTTT
jgi:hypothetical protein